MEFSIVSPYMSIILDNVALLATILGSTMFLWSIFRRTSGDELQSRKRVLVFSDDDVNVVVLERIAGLIYRPLAPQVRHF